MKTEELITQSKENQLLQSQLDSLNLNKSNLQNDYQKLTNAKAFKLWQIFQKTKNNPLLVFKILKLLVTKGLKVILSEIKPNTQIGVPFDINKQYLVWFQKNYPKPQLLKKQKKIQNKFKFKPKISIITPTFNTPSKFLRECIDSVINQTYDNWELCIADDASSSQNTKKIIKEYLRKDKRIKAVFRHTNGHICQASNSAIELATGDFIAILDHDDILWPNALFEIVKCINEKPFSQFIYSDEDKLEEDGKTHIWPFFKPDWSPDYLRSINYITHFAVIKKTLIDQYGKFIPGFEGAQDWELFLRISRELEKKYQCHPTNTHNPIQHVPKILYSWRISPTSTASEKGKLTKNYAFINQKKVLKSDLTARHLVANVIKEATIGFYKTEYQIQDNPLVSIIIPSKDKLTYLTRCLKTLLEKTTYKNYEIILVDTGSKEEQTHNYYKKLSSKHKIKILSWKGIFNFSEVCNYGVDNSKGDYVLLLNNDTEIITPDWIEQMLQYAQRKDVGAVGCKLLYPNNTIQHAGVIMGFGTTAKDLGVAGHLFKYWNDTANDFFKFTTVDRIRNFCAVTAACLLVSKKKYNEVNGLDATFRIAFNDVDFCLKLFNRGYTNIYNNNAILYHHESISVGKPEQGTRDIPEFQKEILLLQNKWIELIKNDPYYNKNLSLKNEHFEINLI